MFSRAMIARTLAKVAAEASHALPLALQLFCCEPCPRCDYIKRYCRCQDDDSKRADQVA
jgi:hypothetical protein